MTTRRVLFQIHWFLGITAGLVLALMGVTGTIMSFEDEIMTALSPGVVTLAPSPAPRLAPDALIAAASRQRGGTRVTQIVIERDPTFASEVTFAPPKGVRRGDHVFVDPRTGALLGPATGETFFRTVMDLHRWLALPGGPNGIGRQITGFAALSLIFFALSGLYLRWPRRALDWRSWFVIDLRRTGRNLYRTLHAVIGGWLIVFYLLSALTGLTWSYDWYKRGATYVLTGKSGKGEKAGERRGEPLDPALPVAPAWTQFIAREGDRFARVAITPATGDKPVVMRVLPRGARFDRMTDELRFDATTGALVKAELYARRSAGATLAANFYALHTGAFFGIVGRILLFASSLTMPLFTITGFLLYFARRRSKRALATVSTAPPSSVGASSGDMLVVHASQTGNAERIARLSAAAFPGATVAALATLDLATLRSARRALFVVATYGEGHAPDRTRATGSAPAWLLYGERSRAHDRPYAAELGQFTADGVLTRTDCVFSRDADCGRYVQHRVAEAADDIAAWADRGAAFYVCGSLVGMAGEVDDALRTILGDGRLEDLAEQGRYCRDIY